MTEHWTQSMPCGQILGNDERAQPRPLLGSDATAGSEILCQHQLHNLQTQDEVVSAIPNAKRVTHSMQPLSLTALTGSNRFINTNV